jgi:hypothetical protein
MSTVIPLRFKSHYDPELLSAGVKFNLIRLLADVDFKTLNGWSPKYQAIIDTGSPAISFPNTFGLSRSTASFSLKSFLSVA